MKVNGTHRRTVWLEADGWAVGAQIAKVLPLGAARVMVTGFGVLLTFIYVWRYWL